MTIGLWRRMRSPGGLALACVLLFIEYISLDASRPSTLAELLKFESGLHMSARGTTCVFYPFLVVYEKRADGWHSLPQHSDDEGPITGISGSTPVGARVTADYQYRSHDVGIWSRVARATDYLCSVAADTPGVVSAPEFDAIKAEYTQFLQQRGVSTPPPIVTRTEWRVLPMGVLSDLLMVLLLAWLPAAAVTRWRAWQDRMRRGNNLCTHCRYDLSGLPTRRVQATCPECGASRDC